VGYHSPISVDNQEGRDPPNGAHRLDSPEVGDGYEPLRDNVSDGAGATVMGVDFRVGEIPVPQSAVSKADPYDLVYYVGILVERMVVQGGFVREELPDEIFMAKEVDYYRAEVNNGGHDQFAANSACLAATLTDIRTGLAAMGDPVAAGIFRDFEARRDVDPEGFDAAIVSMGPSGCLLGDLDDRFFAGPSKTLPATNAAWLRALPHLKPIPDQDYEATIAALLASNPNAPARIAKQYVYPEIWQDREPFVQALRFIAEQADSAILFKRWAGGSSIETPEGQKGGWWVVITNRGQANIWMFPEKTMFQFQNGSEPLVIVPTEAVRHAVQARTGEDIPAEAFGLSAAVDVPPPPSGPGGQFRAALRRLRSGMFGR
jgi:hypothetical protein